MFNTIYTAERDLFGKAIGGKAIRGGSIISTTAIVYLVLQIVPVIEAKVIVT